MVQISHLIHIEKSIHSFQKNSPFFHNIFFSLGSRLKCITWWSTKWYCCIKVSNRGWWKVRVLADLIYDRPPSDIKDVEMHIEKRIIASRTKSQKRKKKMRIYILSLFSSMLFIAFNLFLFWPIILYFIYICAYCWAFNIWGRYAPAVEAAIPL